MTKTCTKCKIEKSFSEFHKRTSDLSGLDSSCKVCNNARGRLNHRKPENIEAKYLYDLNRRKTIKCDRGALNEYQRNYRSNEIVKLNNGIRHLVKEAFKREAFKEKIKKGHTTAVYYLGCPMPFFVEFIKNQLVDYLRFEDYGKTWCLDHINPIGTATTKEEVIKRSHYTNYQPLTISDNLRKNKNLTVPFYA